MQIVDLRREAGYPLSAPLLRELRGVADRGGKAILLLNRRGVAPALHCRACGDDDPLPELRRRARPAPRRRPALPPLRPRRAVARRRAPSCGSTELARLGAGTQKLERELAREFPELELIRLDADTAAKPEQLTAARCAASPTQTRAVLLGTQMVAKGHHFAGVELAAVIDADTSLALPDFRAEERTFQLITQLAGRSGRDAPGPRARPDVPARRAPDRATPHATTCAASSPRSSSAAATSATRRSATSSGSSSRARPGRPCSARSRS